MDSEMTGPLNAPPWIDGMLCVAFVTAALVQYVLIAMRGHSVGRWMQAIGWTGLAMRLMWAFITDQDPIIASISIPFLISASGGTALSAYQYMRVMAADVRCIQDPSQRCAREDRVMLAIREKVRHS
jgi:hypothetical protein